MVTVITVRIAEHEGWTFALPGSLYQSLRCSVNGPYILPIHFFRMNTKGPRPCAHFSSSRLRKVRIFIVEIVLADVDHRQFPQRSHVHSFVEHSLPKRTISEEANCHLVSVLHFAR